MHLNGYLLFGLLTALAHEVQSQESCPRAPWPNDCPGQKNGIRKHGTSPAIIGGLFSASQWVVNLTSEVCSLCSPLPKSNRFAVEQTEALIFATKMMADTISLGYDITDTCGNHEDDSQCVTRQAGIPNLAFGYGALSTIIGPYYSDVSASLTNNEMLDLFTGLAGSGQRDDKGVISLLDEPFPYASQFADIDPLQVVMFQQSCELQAAAAVDFVIQERWVEVTVVGSGDNCGGLSLQLFHDALKAKRLDCHFKVTYLQELPEKVSDVYTQTKQLLEPNYVSSKADSVDSDGDFYNRLFEKKHIVFLSSFFFVNKVVHAAQGALGDVLSHTSYQFLLGDFWGDPRNADSLYDTITGLIGLGQTVYALRSAVNGTDEFEKHMMSIRFNSTDFFRNRFLVRYWLETFTCSLISSNCPVDASLSAVDRPILRNYKAPLVMDAAYMVTKYIVDHRNQTGEIPDEMFDDDVYDFEQGKVLEVFNNYTGNRWKFGIPSSNRSFDWIQPLEWSYEILTGSELTVMYGTWQVNATGIADKSGSLTVLASSPSPNYTLCYSVASSADCDPVSLYDMTGLVGLVLLLLFVIFGIHICSAPEGVTMIKQYLKSPGRLILALDVLLAFAISLWIIFGEEALNCEDRVDDFLVTLTNSLCYLMLIGYLLSHHIDNNMAQCCMQVCGCGVLLAVQIAISAVAHFGIASADGADPVLHCYDERSKAIVAVSYWYSGVLLLGCVVLLLLDLFSASGRFKVMGKAFKVFCGSLAVAVGVVYVVALVNIIWADNQDFCLSHGRFFVVLAIYPGIVCLLAAAVPAIVQLWKLKKARNGTIPLAEAIRVDERSRAKESHVYVFEGFPELTARNQGFTLDEDVMKEIDEILIEPHRVYIKASIGSGNFGDVFKAVLDDISTVAVKSVQDVTSRKDVNEFIREGLQMRSFDHPNVMQLLGICWVKDATSKLRPSAPLLVLPYMELGDLKTYLRKKRPASQRPDLIVAPLGLQQLVKFGHQIARGMDYLSEKDIIHRDLAARNCMVNFDLEIKVADFGLSRSVEGKDYYRMGNMGRLPVKWMAPECLIDHIFTTKSDVWSFGVTLWEVMTLAQSPYPGVDNQDILVYLKHGKRLDKPDECPQTIYAIMSKCWLLLPFNRPTFHKLVEDIEGYLEELMNYFDPLSGGETFEDPYLNWQLLKTEEEEEDKDSNERMQSPGDGKHDIKSGEVVVGLEMTHTHSGSCTEVSEA